VGPFFLDFHGRPMLDVRRELGERLFLTRKHTLANKGSTKQVIGFQLVALLYCEFLYFQRVEKIKAACRFLLFVCFLLFACASLSQVCGV
jgi:hypothetical protein